MLVAIRAGDNNGASWVAAINVDLVHFSELIVSWNTMENVIKVVHVRD